MADRVELRVATANIPETGKRGLTRDRVRRIGGFFRWLNDSAIDVVATVEGAEFTRRGARRRRRWSGVFASATYRVRGWRRGEGVIFRSGKLRVLDRHELVVPWFDPIAPDRVQQFGRIAMPVVLFETRSRSERERVRFVFVGFHAPTRRADRDDSTRQAMRRALIAYANKCIEAGLPVIVAGDANDGDYAFWRSRYRTLAHHGVDWIIGTRDVFGLKSGVSSRPRLSDHDWPWVDVSIPRRHAPAKLP